MKKIVKCHLKDKTCSKLANGLNFYDLKKTLTPVDQGLFSVRALVFDLAQLTSQKRFDGGYEIIEPSTTFLGTSYGQIVVAVFT